MSVHGKRTGLWAILCAISLSVLICTLYTHITSEPSGREHLDQVLGQPPIASEGDQSGSLDSAESDLLFQNLDRLSQQLDHAFLASQNGFSFQIPNVSVEESQAAYILHVPMEQQEDEQNIHLDVKPNRVSISGQFTFRSPDGKQTLGSSSFMKSFSPAQPVNPDQVSRKMKGHELLITIAKQHPGFSGAQTPKPLVPGKTFPGQNLPPDIQRQLQAHSRTFI